jgi:hypothetical protein
MQITFLLLSSIELIIDLGYNVFNTRVLTTRFIVNIKKI